MTLDKAITIMNDDDVKQKLRKNTDEALEYGVIQLFLELIAF